MTAPHRPALRVAVVGTHGTGKTTLVHALLARAQQEGVRCVLAPEVPRRVCELTRDPAFFRRGQNTAVRQLLLLVGHLVHEAQHRAGDHRLAIADRCLLDYWVYTRHLFGAELRAQGVHATLARWVREHTRGYDLVLHLPVEFPPRDDGVREADAGFQAAIARDLAEELDAAGVRAQLIGGAPDARVAASWALIRGRLAV